MVDDQSPLRRRYRLLHHRDAPLLNKEMKKIVISQKDYPQANLAVTSNEHDNRQVYL